MATTLTPILPMVYEQYWAARKRLTPPFDKHANWRKQAKLLGLSKEARQRLEWFIFYETRRLREAIEEQNRILLMTPEERTRYLRQKEENLRKEQEAKAKAAQETGRKKEGPSWYYPYPASGPT